jgi:hypothetical protein
VTSRGNSDVYPSLRGVSPTFVFRHPTYRSSVVRCTIRCSGSFSKHRCRYSSGELHQGGLVKSSQSIVAALLGIVVALVTTDLKAQSVPYITNVRPESPNILRSTLVNPLPVPLTAWSVDVVDATGRPRTTQTSDALLVPDKFVPAKGSIEFEIATDDVGHRNLDFAAAVSADGMEVGDTARAFAIMSARVRRAAALETVLEFLRTTDPATTTQTLFEDIKSLVGARDEAVVHDLRSKAASGPVAAWVAAATEIRNKNQAGAVRHGILRE